MSLSLPWKKEKVRPSSPQLSRAEASPVLATLHVAIKAKPNDVATYKALGNVYCNVNEYRLAIDYYRKAQDLSPQDPDLYCFIGFCYQQLGLHRQSLINYQKALTLRPSSEIFNVLGDLCYLMGQQQEALAYYQGALKQESSDTRAHFNTAQILLGYGRPQEAMGHLEAVVKRHPRSGQAHSDLAVALSLVGDHDQAISHLKTSLKLDKVNPVFHHNYGVVLARQGKKREAMGRLEKALKLDPHNTQTQRILADLAGSQSKATN